MHARRLKVLIAQSVYDDPWLSTVKQIFHFGLKWIGVQKGNLSITPSGKQKLIFLQISTSANKKINLSFGYVRSHPLPQR